MKERPILFSAPMVRAILDGRKTQTRRVVKGLDGVTHPIVRNEETGEWGWWWTEWRWEGSGLDARHVPYAEHFHALRCPYGAPGDRLYVRETWAEPNDQVVIYRANWREDAKARGLDNIPPDDSGIRWCPGIHMPRWASRITLEITEVRVERLQDISEADAIAEGMPTDAMHYGGAPASAVECFSEIWREINGAGSWDANPWVWVVVLRRVAQEAKAA